MKALREIVDGGVGETRVGLFDGERAIALNVLRWSDQGRRARWGEVYSARVRTVDSSRRGAFLDLGLGEGAFGFLPSGRTSVREGETVRVRIVREAAGGKSAVLQVLGSANGVTLGRIDAHEADEQRLRAPPASKDDRALLDEAFAEALSPTAAVSGGGRLIIEPTSALVAIDVDAAGRRGGADGERFARDLNIAAAVEALRQLRLRNLGGLVAIDFVSMRAADDRKAVELAVRTAAKGDPWGVQVAPMSRFGVVELSRGRLQRPHAEAMAGAEALALEALRRMEHAARDARGRRVIATLPKAVADWLNAAHIPWREALDRRIGALWRIEAAPDGTPIDMRLE